MSRYGNLGAFDYKVTNVPQYDLEADIDRNMAAGMKFGAMIGQGIQKARESEANKVIARQKEIANQLALDKIDAATREGLILKSDDDAGALNDSRIDFSNMLVDRLNQAKISRDNGTLTAADYSKVVMTLEAQIPAYKAAEKILYADVATYMESVEEGNQSLANKPETIEFLSAMSTGRADVSYTFDKNNKMQLTGTWTDSQGNDHPIEAAIEKFEQLPRILTAPQSTAFEQRQADIANVMETQQGSAMTKVTSTTDPATGLPMYESTIEPLTVKIDGKEQLKPWFKEASENSFNGYFDSLGNGDLRMGLKQYLLDSTQSGLGYEEVSKMIDGASMQELKAIKEEQKQEYIDDMIGETLAANKLKVAELEQNDLGDKANLAKDQTAIMNALKSKNKLKEEATSGKEGSKTSSNSSELTDIYNTILSTPIEDNLSTNTVLSGPTPYIERIKPVLSKYNYYMDVDEDGNFLLGKAGMKDQKKKRKIDPSRIQNISLLMEEIAALNNEKWSTPQPIIVK